MASNPDPWLTVEDVLAELDITRSTWDNWRARRCTPPMVRLPNGRLRCRRSTLEAWMDSLEEGAA